MFIANSKDEFARAEEHRLTRDVVELDAVSLVEMNRAAFDDAKSINPASGFAIALILGSTFWLALVAGWLLL